MAGSQAPTAIGVAGLAALAALLVLALVLLAVSGGEGGRAGEDAADPGGLVTWGLPVVRVVADLSGMLVVGALLVACALAPAARGQFRGPAVRLTRTASLAAVVLACAGALVLVLSLADDFGLPLGQVADATTLTSFVTDTALGRGLLVQVVLAVAVALAAPLTLSVRGAFVLLLLAVTALVAPAFGGHTAAAGDHSLALTSLVVHVVAVSLWVGGLGALGLLAVRDEAALPAVTRRFSVVATWCVVAVVVSGVANAAVRLSEPADLLTTAYGGFLVAKAVALAALAGMGYAHRRRTLPRLDGPHPRRVFARLAAAEIVVMSATVGLAVALSRTHAPDESAAEPGPAAQILGYPLPPEPTALRLLLDARPAGFWLTVVALGVALYVAGVRAMRRRGDRWPAGRLAAWLAGMALLAVVTSGGVGRYAPVLFSVHMVQHMALNMVVPLLLVLGAPVTLALRVLPSKDAGARESLLAILHSRPVRVLANPLVAAAIFVGSLYGLYFSTLFEALMRNHWGHVAMQAHFLLAGFLFFWVLVGIDPGPRRLPYLFRLPLLFVAMALHAFFSVALLSMTAVLAEGYYAALDRPWGGSLLDDQQLGGAIGWAFGEVPIVVVLVVVFVQWVRADERAARAADRAAEREPSDDALAAYNAWLASLDRGPQR